MLVASLPEEVRQRARMIGLFFALLFRLLLVSGVFYLVKLTPPLVGHFSLRELIFLVGGIFLMGKAGKELYSMIEKKELKNSFCCKKKLLAFVIIQIVILDLLFSVDSVITAVGLTRHLMIVVIAVIASFIVVLWYAGPLGEFIIRHPSLKIIALSFIFIIGGNLVAEGFEYNLPQEWIYVAMAFACIVEFLQMRYRRNQTLMNKEENL